MTAIAWPSMSSVAAIRTPNLDMRTHRPDKSSSPFNVPSCAGEGGTCSSRGRSTLAQSHRQTSKGEENAERHVDPGVPPGEGRPSPPLPTEPCNACPASMPLLHGNVSVHDADCPGCAGTPCTPTTTTTSTSTTTTTSTSTTTSTAPMGTNCSFQCASGVLDCIPFPTALECATDCAARCDVNCGSMRSTCATSACITAGCG